MSSDRPAPDTLAAALPREMVRVAGLIPLYRAVANGEFAAALMQRSIDRAQAAIAEGDLAEMVRACADLRNWSA